MCGFVGAIGGPQPQFEMVVDRLSHRGPDARGVRHLTIGGREHYLGHRRLSIIDLSAAANQPFEKDGLLAVYNGEIYNYADLRAELSQSGVSFLTRSDTEVVVEAWRRWGADSLRRLRGMFAFAILDRRSGETVIARDFFGIKPLYYHASSDTFAYASEIKALLPLLREPVAIDPDGLVASLLYLWIPEQHTIYRGIEKLTPGTWLHVDAAGRTTHHRYWHPRELLHRPCTEPDTATLRTAIEESVRRHMVADVPVATLLSGGLDSSLITALAARHAGSIEAYTIAFRQADLRLEAMPDDLLYARRVARREGVQLHEIEIAPDVVDLLPRLVHALDEPIGDPAAINVFLICSAARAAGAKVLLSGMGADEMFGGYRRHRASLLAAHYRRLPTSARAGASAIMRHLPVASSSRGFRTIRWAKRFLDFADLPEEAAYRRSYTYYDRCELVDLAGDDVGEVVDRLFAEHAAIYAEAEHEDHVTRMCYADTQLFLPGLNLTYTDRASMAAATEIRVPFVDLEIARLAFALPGRRKIAHGHTKLALKQAAEAWLPRDIVNRPKAAFGAPLRAWIRRDLRDMISDLLPGGQLVQRGLVRSAAISALIERDASGEQDNAHRLWHLLTLEAWLRQRAHANA
jgi:asparagine synthase (glutamine-hydrolysing)